MSACDALLWNSVRMVIVTTQLASSSCSFKLKALGFIPPDGEVSSGVAEFPWAAGAPVVLLPVESTSARCAVCPSTAVMGGGVSVPLAAASVVLPTCFSCQ